MLPLLDITPEIRSSSLCTPCICGYRTFAVSAERLTSCSESTFLSMLRSFSLQGCESTSRPSRGHLSWYNTYNSRSSAGRGAIAEPRQPTNSQIMKPCYTPLYKNNLGHSILPSCPPLKSSNKMLSTPIHGYWLQISFFPYNISYIRSYFFSKR
jgi:hypothetical protein